MDEASTTAQALQHHDESVRLRAAMACGAAPDPARLEVLVERCAVEPDFFVRDMLSWALVRLPPALTLPRLRRELDDARPQSRSQALHTLSKIGDHRAYAWVTDALLRDADDEVARTAWRAAVALAPEPQRADLADRLATQLGRGDRSLQRSLSRAVVDLGETAAPVLRRAGADPDPRVAVHARATELMRADPDLGFDGALDEARRAGVDQC